MPYERSMLTLAQYQLTGCGVVSGRLDEIVLRTSVSIRGIFSRSRSTSTGWSSKAKDEPINLNFWGELGFSMTSYRPGFHQKKFCRCSTTAKNSLLASTSGTKACGAFCLRKLKCDTRLNVRGLSVVRYRGSWKRTNFSNRDS